MKHNDTYSIEFNCLWRYKNLFTAFIVCKSYGGEHACIEYIHTLCIL